VILQREKESNGTDEEPEDRDQCELVIAVDRVITRFAFRVSSPSERDSSLTGPSSLTTQ
jgi:hypothetical protein